AVLDGNRAGWLLLVVGRGRVQLWNRNGRVATGIALAGDGKIACNLLMLVVVRNAVGGNLPLSPNVAPG
ncbi:hypothetical protein AAGG49_23210, partial [Stenotrophomonas maltophilia]